MSLCNAFIFAVPALRSSSFTQSILPSCQRGSSAVLILKALRSRRVPATWCSTPPPSCSQSPQRNVAPRANALATQLSRISSVFVNLFPVWTVLASAVALHNPYLFQATTSPPVMQGFLSLLMLSTGLTLTPQDIFESLKKPLPVLFNFVVCFVVVPLVAIGLSILFGLEGKVKAGLLLLAMISGGQASNLCTHIAGGDTALSVTMTTATTLSASLMLPILSSLFLGTVVPVNRLQMALTTAQVTLLPIIVGALSNQLFPGTVSSIRPLLPVLGIIAVIVLVVGPAAQTSAVFAAAWRTLLFPVLLLHILGGVIGFVGSSLMKAGWKTSITTAFETAFKSPVLGYVLAKRLFPPGVELASAVSVVVLVPLSALFAVILKQRRSEL